MKTKHGNILCRGHDIRVCLNSFKRRNDLLTE